MIKVHFMSVILPSFMYFFLFINEGDIVNQSAKHNVYASVCVRACVRVCLDDCRLIEAVDFLRSTVFLRYN